jgi:hypothetical protein
MPLLEVLQRCLLLMSSLFLTGASDVEKNSPPLAGAGYE